MNSVLLIGSDYFTASVIAQVRGLDVFTSTAASNVPDAIALMEKGMPDVVIVQASQLVEGSVLKTFSQERHSVYFIVLDESESLVLDQSSNCSQDGEFKIGVSQLPVQTPAQTMEDLSEHYIEKRVIALEAGADAYISLLPAEGKRSEQYSGKHSSQYSGKHASKHSTASEQAAHNGATVSTVSQSAAPLLFRKSQQRLIQAYVQIGLNRAQRYRDLSRINDWLSAVALVDALTQLSNRRSFDLELPRQIKMARAKNTPLSLMVVDIDFFKSVNDRYGHLVGDDVLKMLAKRLLANMRFYDTPFRYGGEEFVITLNNTDLTEGRAIAERLRHSIDQDPFKVARSVNGTMPLPLTVSIGLTELHDSDDDRGRDFLHRADQYLLKAKASGRNQVVSDHNPL